MEREIWFTRRFKGGKEVGKRSGGLEGLLGSA